MAATPLSTEFLGFGCKPAIVLNSPFHDQKLWTAELKQKSTNEFDSYAKK